MTVTVCTGWSPKGWTEYGRNFVETFDRHWPDDIRVLAYVEEPVSLPARFKCRNVLDIPGCRSFIERHAGNLQACGRAPNPRWKDRERENGYSYRFDAVKFCRQGFIPWHAAQGLANGDILVWLDADVVTFSDVPAGFIESLLPDGAAVSYLGRGAKHSEIGFQAYRLPAAMPMLEMFKDAYATDRVFDLSEWHSAWVFDWARTASGVPGHDLTPGGSGHVWFQCQLGAVSDHLKGNRKAAGRSRERK